MTQPYTCTACRLGAHDRCDDRACWCDANDHLPDPEPPEAA